jgi:hypothetical protein
LLVYTPTELLLPNTEYWVRFSTTKDLKEWGHNDVYFRTGDAVDSIGPSYTVGADKDSGWVFDADFSSSEPILIVSTYVCESMGCYGTGTTPSDSTLYIQYAGTDNVLELTAWDRAGNHKTIRTSARYQGNTQGGCAVVHTNSQSAAPIVLTVLITIAALYLYARRKRAAQYT